MRYDMYSRHGFARTLEASELPGVVGLDEVDVEVAIDLDGWCGCLCDVEPVVLVAKGTFQFPSEGALRYLHPAGE